jgi:hypothetical protein
VLCAAVPTRALAQSSADNDPEPIPYTKEEFPQWALDLRRAEVLTVGMFPLAFLVTRLGYDVARFTYRSIRQGSPAQQYAPWFFAPPEKPDFTRAEKNGILLASVSISGIVALVDYLIGTNERSSHAENGADER